MDINENAQILKHYENEVYKFLDVGGAIKTLENQTLQFSNPSVFNDPFDCSEQMLYVSDKFFFIQKYLNSLDGNEKEEIISKYQTESDFTEYVRQSISHPRSFKFICFSKQYFQFESGLLWSHYAQKHEGISLCFDFGLTYPFLCYEIEYFKSFPEFDFNCETFIRMFYSKSEIWRYENEVRAQIFAKSEEKYENIKFPMKSLKKVIFGLRTEEHTISKIREILFEKYDVSKIAFEKMELDTETFSLKPVPYTLVQ